MTRNREQDAEEESSASEGKRETVGKPTGKEAVGKPTGKTPDMQNVRDVTEINILNEQDFWLTNNVMSAFRSALVSNMSVQREPGPGL